MSEIKISNVILHVLDNNHQAPILSVKELDFERETYEFLERHVLRMINGGDLKETAFDQSKSMVFHKLKQFLDQEIGFVDVSRQFADYLFKIMKQNPDIPAGDAVFLVFQLDSIEHLALLKLNYRSSYIHYVVNTEEGNLNKIVKQKTALPNDTQKVEEGFIVNLQNFDLKVLEKQYEIAGEREYYLSKYFLKCDINLSPLQKVRILEKAGHKITKKYYDEDFNKITKLKNVICEEIEGTNEIKVDVITKEVFGGNQEIQKAYLEEIERAGLVDKVVSLPSKAATSKKFTSQRVKTDSGIEINFPAHVYNNKDLMEFINNPDGTISILIKNINKVINK